MIKKIKVTKEKNNKKILKTLKPYVAYWLEKNFKTLTLPQQYAIPLIKNGKNVLITAPTGSGKTLAAFCSIIDELFSLAEEKKLENKVYCIYISPLRALDNDIKRNLLIPLTEIPKIANEKFNVELEEIRIGIRTGDTLPREKQKQLLKPPHILITTPESIAIILATRKFKEKLKDVKWVIIDEIHELADSKRGVHLSLSLERLENFVGKRIQRIGLGATLEPLEEAAKFLVGMENGKPRECYIIDARFVKPIDIKVLIPTKDLVYSSAEEINKNLYELLDDLISKHRTTLVFTNTRSGAERVHFHLKQMFPSKYLDEVTGVHHSSVSRDIRFEVEERLKRGELKAVICVAPDTEILTTSSWKEISKMKDNFKILALDPSDLQVKKTKFYNVNCRKWLGYGLFIKTKTGKELKCTPEHKLLTIKNGELNWICARDLKEGDFIGTIREVLLPKIPPPHYVDIVKDCFVSLPMSSLNYLKNKLYEYFENLKLASSKVDIPYSHLISSLNGCRKMKLEELKKICYAINDRDFIYSFVRGIGTRKVTVRLRNKVMSKEFLRFFGFFLAEGCFDKFQIRVTNKHKSLLEKYHKIIFKEFGLKKKIQKDKNGVYHLRYYSNFLRNILIKLGAPTGRKSHNIFIPNFIFRLPKDYISEFISGYFDGDGSLKIYNKRVSSASFCTTSAKMAKDLQKLLLCVGVMSVVREGKTKVHDKINGRKIKRKGMFYIVEVMGGGYLRKFASLINPFRSNLRKIKDVLNSKGSCNQDVIPNVGSILRELRRSLNLSTKFLEKRGVYVRRYEKGKRNISRRKLLDLLNFYKKFGRGYYYHYLRKLALSNIFWDKVKEIKPIKLNRVYDIVDVRNFHNFVANCIFVQNSSTSLELGIDIGHITEVVQIGSPKSVSRLMQRIGRAGHSLKEVSEGRVICLDRDDLIECLVMTKKCYEYWLDKFTMPRNCLDVLAQHLLGMAIEKKWNVKEAFEVVRRAYSFSTLKFETFVRVLEYLAGKYHTLEDYKVYGKIWFDEKDMMFGRRGKYARVIYSLNVGTIPDEVKIKVKSLDGKFIGFIEEGFLERLTKGDIFVLGGKTYEFVKAKKSTAFVLPVKEKRPTIPSWFSEQLPLSFDLALEVARFRERIMKEIERKSKEEVIELLKKEYLANEDVARNVYDYLKLELEFLRKFKVKKLPSDKVIFVENFIDEENNQNIVFHTLFGRRVNDALSRAFAYALMKKIERSIRVSISDNGFILTIPPEIIEERFYSLFEIKKISKENRIDPKELVKLVNTKNFEELLVKSLENTELIKRKFRHVANRSLMILRNYKGYEISVEKQQMSAERLIRIVKKIKGFPVLEETYREILQDFMDVENAKMIIEKIEKGEIKYEFLPLLDLPSPFAHNLFAISESDVVLMEDRKKLLLKLHEKIVKKLGIK